METFQEQLLRRRNSRQNWDRFIPNRSAMDFGYANYMLTERNRGNENKLISRASEAYRKRLAEALGMNRTRILAFKDRPSTVAGNDSSSSSSSTTHRVKPTKPHRKIPQTSERILDAPDILHDYYLNVRDWGSSNLLSISLGSTVYLWNASDGSTSELVTVDEECGPVTSLRWAPDGRNIAVGLNNSEVQLWDSAGGGGRLLRTLRGGHVSRVGSLDWNGHILTTGGMEGRIVNNDVRMRAHMVETYRGHRREVCSLNWSGSQHHLASGGFDNLVHIWDRRSSNSSSTRWIYRFEQHTGVVKAIAWCPLQGNVVASGGAGEEDGTIKLWNTNTGACLNTVDTGSRVSALVWNKKEFELLSSHGLPDNQLTLWKYPAMVKMAELTGHSSSVLHMSRSPDGCQVASAAADETLRF